MNLFQYISTLRARWRLIALVVVATLSLAVVGSLILPRTYTATTTILLDIKVPDRVGGAALTSLMPEVLQGYLTAQAEIIASEKSASKVVKKLELDKNDTLRTDWEKVVGEKRSLDMWLIDYLRMNLSVKPARESNVISVSFSSRDKSLSAAIANAFAEAYLETDLDLKVEPARKSAIWFDERTQAMRGKLEQAQRKLSDFQRQKGIVITSDERFEVENARLNELATQLTLVQTATVEAESKRRQAGSLPEVIQSPVAQALRADLARQEAKLRELGAQLGANHPQYQRIEAETKALRERVAIEMAQVAGSVGASAQVTQQREAQTKAAYEAQKSKVLSMKAVRDEGALLLRDVENARREYDVLLQRLAQTSLESQANQTNIVVLNRAVEPLYPSSPRFALNAVVGLFVGSILGVVIALLLEATDRRLRDANDITEMLDLPVLAVVRDTSSITRLSLQSQSSRLPRLGSATS